MAISKVVVVDGNNLIVRIDRGVAGRGVTDVEPIEIDGSLYLVFTFSDGTTETVGPVGTIQYIGQTPIVVTGSTISLSTVPVNLGGTGQTTANAGFNALAPTQTGNAGKYLKTDGTNSAWDLLDISTADITGVLPIANGGTNASTASGARTNLGLGTIATQDASAVAITGGSITGITDLAVADGGTGASTAAGAMVNLLPSYTGNANKRLGLDSTASGLEWVTDGGGTVTSVDVSGGTTGLSFTGGPVTTSGTITLSGTLDVDNGGTGATTAAGARTNLNAADQALTLTAGTGLSGGGDLSANRTFSITNTGVTAASYGSASNTLTATVNAQGQLTALAATPIAISNTQVSGLGTMSTQNSNAVTITGGSITGITDLAIADGGTGASNAADARSNLGLGTAAVLNAGVALGVATLDAGGTVPLSQIPASIQGGVSYQGAWNASTNTPTLTSSVGTKGHYYVVSVAGNTNLNGVTDWLVGDWAIYNGTAWEKIDNTDQVASVNGYTGVVVLTNTDVGAPPTSLTISAGTGLNGGGNLTTNRTLSIANTAVSAGSYGTASAVPTFTVNGQGQLTAASDVTIAISNTQVSGLGTMSTQNANSVAITGGSITGITDLAIADGGTGASTAGGALTNLGAIGTITSTDGSIVVTPSGTTVDLAVSAASPASTLLTQVRNTTGATLTKGTVVYISGATGQIATVSKAIATGDATSAQTLGMITSDLANNSNGYVTVFGLLENMDTSAYTDGAQLYLSGTTAGAVTATKPSAPTHLVYVAVVEYAHPTQGKLLVKVQNGYELDEIHDVSIVSPVTGQTLVYNATTDLWVNNTVSLTAGVNGTLPIANGGTGQTTANAAFNALAPSQTGNSGKYLTTDGTDTSWASNPLGTVTSVGGTGTVSGITLSGTVTTSGNLTLGGALDLSAYNGAGAFTTLSASSTVTLSGGTANGVTYLNGSKQLVSGSALTFDGTTFAVSAAVTGDSFKKGDSGNFIIGGGLGGTTYLDSGSATDLVFRPAGTEGLRLTSTSLYTASGINVGIGTSSPSYKLHAVDNGNINATSAISNSTAGTSSLARFLAISDAGSAIFAMTSSSYTDISGAQDAMLLNANNASGGIAFALDGTLKMKLDSAGNLGIGTSSPATRLSVDNTRSDTAGTGWFTYTNVAVTSGKRGMRVDTNNVYWFDYYNGSSWSAQMGLDSAGNLGLGVTPSAWYSPYGTKVFQFAASGVLYGLDVANSDRRVILQNNAYVNASGNEIYLNTGAATKFLQSAGAHSWHTAASGTAGDAISFTQAMTLDADGDLNIGTTTSNGYRLNVRTAPATSGLDGAHISDGTRLIIAGQSGATYNYAGIIGNENVIYTSGNPLNIVADGQIIKFSTGNEIMRITSAGNVGIGDTNPAYKFVVSQTVNANSINTQAAFVDIGTTGGNLYQHRIVISGKSGAGSIDIGTTDSTTLHFGNQACTFVAASTLPLYIYQASAQPILFATTGSEKARITSDGNLLVGLTSGALGSRLEVKSSNTSLAGFTSSDVSGTSYALTANAGKLNHYATYATSGIDCYHAWWLTASSGAQTQAMTLDASGNLLVGTTSASGTGAYRGVTIGGGGVSSLGSTYDYLGALYRYNTVNENGWGWWNERATGGAVQKFYVTSSFTEVGSISCSTTATAYNTSSDYRLKNTIAPMTGALAKVAQLKPVTYKWNSNGSDGEGFIAHELAEVVPQCVTGEKDAVDENGKPQYQGIDVSFLVATLTAAIQEQQAIIESLKARLDAANL